MSELPKECKDNLSKLNKLINKAVKEIKIANTRAESAEKMLSVIRKSSQAEIEKAYKTGFEHGRNSMFNSDNTGGTSKNKEDVVKLVLNNNNN